MNHVTESKRAPAACGCIALHLNWNCILIYATPTELALVGCRLYQRGCEFSHKSVSDLTVARLSDLGDLVVVGQEHGQVLRLLDGRRLRHLPQELGCSGGEEDKKLHVLITKHNIE